ncbi:hypothetical protein JCM12298_14450 [Desulfothermus naphthae]
MCKKLFLQVLTVLFVGFLLVGCAKKKINNYAQPTVKENQPSALTQEDLTKNATSNIKTESEETGNVNEYAVKSEEISSENLNKESNKFVLPVLPEVAKKEIKKRIHFAFDSYELNDDAKEILKKKAEVLLKYPSIKLVIEGHCDERGTEEYNLALGERRARAAYEYLIMLGIEADRLSIVSYGEERPLDPRHNEEAWAKNRRDEFKIVN